MSDIPTSNNSTNRRRTLITLIVAFLLIGGGVFTFLIFQGLGDLKGENNGAFSYGFAARNIVLPLSNYFSLGDNEARSAGKAMRPLPPGMESSLLDGTPAADISDWMAKGAAGTNTGASAGRASGAPPLPGGKTSVPRMGGGLGSAVGGGGGGGSKSSGSPSKFSPGSDASNTSVTGAKDGKGLPAGRSGTLNALSSARAALSDGLKSGSAMTAKSKWDQGFGLGSTGKKTGDLAYGKSGLVGLDHIKKGDIADLKMTGAQTLKTAEPTPEKDEAATAKDAKAKSDLGADAAKEALGKAVSETGKQNAKDPTTGKPIEPIPPHIITLATTPPPEGSYCPAIGPGCSYQDTKVVYEKRDDGKYTVRYEGNLGDPKQSYQAAFVVDPAAKTPQLTCAAWADNYTGEWGPSGGGAPGSSGCP